MTIKHIKFEDSEIMRSFEKVAKEKGLVQPDSVESRLVRMAATKTIEPAITDNVTVNLLKLCSGLRDKGFAKYATAIETKMMAVKQAETSDLYDVQDEDGTDLLERAHPDGSVLMAPAQDEGGVVEDLLDRQEKILEVAKKEPKTANIILMCRIALGQGNSEAVSIEEAPEEENNSALQNVKNMVKEAYIMAHNAYIISLRKGNLAESKTGHFLSLLNDIKAKFALEKKDKSTDGVTATNLEYFDENIDNVISSFEPSLLAGISKTLASGITDETVWRQVSTLLEQCKSKIQYAKNSLANSNTIVTNKQEQVSSGQQGVAANTLQPLYTQLINNIRNYKAVITSKKLPNLDELNQWLDKGKSVIDSDFKDFTESLKTVDGEYKDKVLKNYQDRFNDFAQKLNLFKEKWIA